MKYFDVIIVGSGPTGLFSTLNIRNKTVLLIDANNEIGGKIKISGGGRSNISNNKDIDRFLEAIYKNQKFLYPSLNNFSPKQVIKYFETNNIKLKEEEDNKMFPQSNKSQEFLNFFESKIKSKNNIEVRTGYLVEDIVHYKGKFIINDDFTCKYLVMATGGTTYPHISQGKIGYDLLENLNHSVTDLKPASTPLVINSELIASKRLQGTSISKCRVDVFVDNKKKKTVIKDVLITHFGLSGPGILDVSGYIKEQLDYSKKVTIHLTPGDEISKRLRKYLEENKELVFDVVDVKGFKVAFLTNGGIKLNEVDPQTLESKINNNLFIGGEVLDLHAITGGYNIAMCFSMGKLIGDEINAR